MRKNNKYLILVMALMAVTMAGVMHIWSVFINPLEELFGWTRSQTTFTYTLSMVFFGLGMFSGGMMLNKVKAKNTIRFGGFFLGLGFLLASFTNSLTWLYVSYGLLIGLGIGFTNMVPMTVAISWFPKQKGVISGTVSLFLSLGALGLSTFIIPYLINHYGLRNTFKILALITFLTVNIAALFLKLPEASENSEKGSTEKLWGYPLKKVLCLKATWQIVFWGFMVQSGGMLIISHAVPYVIDLGFTRQKGLLAITFYSLSVGIGSISIGKIYDAFGRLASLLTTSLCVCFGLLASIYLVPILGYSGLLIGVTLVGISFGGAICHFAFLNADFFGPRYFAANLGFFTLPGVLAAFLGPLLGAYIKDSTGNYQSAILIAIGLNVIAIVICFIVKKPEQKTFD